MTFCRGKPKLLVVDDEPQILVAITDLFEDDFQILTAPDGYNALGLLDDNDVAVILSDQRMPGLSGDEFLRQARDRSEATRVLITGYTDISALVRAVNVGKIHAYVSKPWNPVELRTIVLNAAKQYDLMQELSHERSLLNSLLDNVPDAIFFLDAEGRFERVNAAKASRLGISDPAAAIGRTPADFLDDSPAARIMAENRRVMDSGECLIDNIHKVEGGDGTCCWMSTTKAPIRDKHGEAVGLVGISRNVTGRMLAEEALRQAHDGLERAVEERTRELKQEIAERTRAEAALIQAKELAEAANRAKTAFLANMSHELRTPLNAIIGFADVIRTEVFGPVGGDRYREYIENIHESGEHLLNIISDILDVSRIEAGKVTLQEGLVDVPAVLSGAWRLLEHLAEEGGLSVSFKFSEELPRLRADERLLKQALVNVMSNAVKFTPAGGRITIAARIEDACLAIAVADSGIGIARGDLEMVLRPFGQVESSTVRKHAGTGLGLPLSKAFVELHGGRFEIDSEIGRGTTVLMRFCTDRLTEAGEALAPA